jgi:hypothetical protein
MRIPKWLLVLFFASLALNLGVLAGYGYQTYLWAQERKRARIFYQGWAPDAERRFHALLDERQESMYRLDSLRVLTNERLDELTYTEHPDSMEVEQLLDQSAQLDRELARVAYRTGRGILEFQSPEMRRQSEQTYRRMLGLKDHDSTGVESGPGRKALRGPKAGRADTTGRTRGSSSKKGD